MRPKVIQFWIGWALMVIIYLVTAILALSAASDIGDSAWFLEHGLYVLLSIGAINLCILVIALSEWGR